MVEDIRARGTDVDIEVEWTSQWRDALAPAADRCGADLIVKAAGSHWAAGRRLLKTSDWTLLRNAHCPRANCWTQAQRFWWHWISNGKTTCTVP